MAAPRNPRPNTEKSAEKGAPKTPKTDKAGKSAPTPPAGETTLLRAQRAADLTIFGTREHSHRGNPIQLRTEVRNLQERLLTTRRREGSDAHFVGTVLTRLWHGRADEVFGFTSFEAFSTSEFDLPRSSAYKYVRLAAYATATESEWGVDAVMALASIVDLVRSSPKLQKKLGFTAKPQGISDLVRQGLPLPGNRALRLQPGRPLVAALVNESLQHLRSLSGLDTGGLTAKADLAETEELRRTIEDRPEYAGVDARIRRRGGKRVLQLTVPEGTDLVRLAKDLSGSRTA